MHLLSDSWYYNGNGLGYLVCIHYRVQGKWHNQHFYLGCYFFFLKKNWLVIIISKLHMEMSILIWHDTSKILSLASQFSAMVAVPWEWEGKRNNLEMRGEWVFLEWHQHSLSILDSKVALHDGQVHLDTVDHQFPFILIPSVVPGPLLSQVLCLDFSPLRGGC